MDRVCRARSAREGGGAWPHGVRRTEGVHVRTIYLAGASSEAELVGSYMRKIEDFGEEVAYDWTRLVLANLANGIKDTDLTNRQRRCIADDCVDSIREADRFWLLIPED